MSPRVTLWLGTENRDDFVRETRKKASLNSLAHELSYGSVDAVGAPRAGSSEFWTNDEPEDADAVESEPALGA